MDEAKLCECGCGEAIEPKPHHRYRGTPRFKNGHFGRTAEGRERMREAHSTRRAGIEPPNPSGLCMCGCGEPTPIAKTTHQGRHMLAGHPLRYVFGHRQAQQQRGSDSPQWKGGRYTQRGRIRVHAPDHPCRDKYGYVYEHRLVMEDQIGRLLRREETVHHKNGDSKDNRPENLELWASRHPKGQRVEDLVTFALEILDLYAPERLR